ncbi:hypothetical protein [Azospirillum soli]|uniref:hypothetical protein n=1 Tax=Azospirillum soli TaxID=1304799 RepID=UPI001AE9B29B|nr:hypothetical protein [Azospirillum soli]MBP2315451.1 hypothetical protein [Azospirillum soli]
MDPKLARGIANALRRGLETSTGAGSDALDACLQALFVETLASPLRKRRDDRVFNVPVTEEITDLREAVA